MAVNVVIALVYYLRWTALLFAAAPDERAGAPAPMRSRRRRGAARPRLGAPRPSRSPPSAGIALSGAPQLVAPVRPGRPALTRSRPSPRPWPRARAQGN